MAGIYFPSDIFKCIFLNENVWISVKMTSVDWSPKVFCRFHLRVKVISQMRGHFIHVTKNETFEVIITSPRPARANELIS